MGEKYADRRAAPLKSTLLVLRPKRLRRAPARVIRPSQVGIRVGFTKELTPHRPAAQHSPEERELLEPVPEAMSVGPTMARPMARAPEVSQTEPAPD